MMTERQRDYLSAMDQFFRDNDQLPPFETLAVLVGSTTNAAAEMCQRLEKYEVLARNEVGKYKRGPQFDNALAMAKRYAESKCAKTMRVGLDEKP